MARNRVKELRVVRAKDVEPNPRNWRLHPSTQRDAMERVIGEVGVADALLAYEPEPGRLVLIDGHLRRDMMPEEEVPVLILDLDENEANIVLASLDPMASLAMRSDELMQSLVADLDVRDADLLRLLEEFAGEPVAEPEDRPEKDGPPPSPRVLPLDAIFTISGNTSFCCLAVRAGFSYGIQSGRGVCPALAETPIHKLDFIDNDYERYDHQVHLDFVAEHRPKYATTRDMMSRQQCVDRGIEYYDIDQVLRFAEDLSAHADNVIVIPKLDILDEIPEEYVLGYSVPTSHGGTDIPLERFKGRKVHLLGGSWAQQRAYLRALGEDVVSFDNNYIFNIARWGNITYPDGATSQLRDIGFGHVTNPMYTALALSLGGIGAALKDFSPNYEPPIPEGEVNDHD